MSKSFWVAGLLPVAAIAAPQADSPSTEQTMVVTASRFAEPEASILAPVNIVTREEISRLQAKTVTEVMRTLPGVETISYGGHGQSASTAVRGGTSAQTLVLVDGIRVNAITSGGANLNDLPLNQVERIEYVRGARASIYGADAIGGVINIITRPDVGTQRHQFSGGAGSLGERQLAWNSATTVGKTGQFKGAAGFEQEDGYNVHPVAGVNDGDEHGYEGYNAMLDYQQALNDHLDLFTTARWFRNQAQYDNSYSGSWGSQHERKETWSDNQSYLIGGRYHEGKYQSELQGNYGREDLYNYPDSISHDAAQDRTYIRQYNLSWLHDLTLTDAWRLGTGIDWRRERLTPDSVSSGVAYSDDTHGRDNTGLYALSQYQQGAWQAELSVRTDDNDQYGRHNTWQAGAGWTFFADYRLSGRYGTGFRAPSFNDLYFPDAYTPGNPDLQPEESKNRELMLDGVTQMVIWRVTGYRNDIDQMIQWAPDDSGLWRPENVGQARIDGLELEAEFDTAQISHRLSADLKDPQDTVRDKQLQRIAKRNAKWVAQANVQQWEGSLSWIYQGERYDDATNTVKLGGYSLWDMGVGYSVNPHLKLQGRLANMLDKQYETAVGYPAAGRAFYMTANYQL
jgi:vitamin B12 transporter